MADVQIYVSNDRTTRIIRDVNEKCIDALELCGQQGERNAKINLEHDPRRIDTGLLRNSVTHALAGNAPAILTYTGSNASRYHPDDGIPSGSYSGIMPNEGKMAVYIGTNVEYAPYVEYGTQRMRANHFIRNSLSEHIPEYKQIIETVLRDGMR